MSKETCAVYLEDIEAVTVPSSTDISRAPSEAASSSPPSSQPKSQPDNASDATDTTKKPSAPIKVTVGAPLKRQRTLVDMFGAGPSTKKAKSTASTTTTTTTVAKTTVAVTKKLGAQTLNSIPFNMASFLQGLTEEQTKLLKLECETMGKSWLKLLKDEITKPYFLSLKRFLWEEGVQHDFDPPNPAKLKIYPAPRDIYTWSQTPLGKLKVVIIGQDPYHGPGQAHGLCFSVRPGVAIPPSLRNIYAEVKAEYPSFEPPKHGTLTPWTHSGVLLLNACLTVRAGQAGSHQNRGWERFTDTVLDVVDRYGGANLNSGNSDDSNERGKGRGVVFMAWGSWAAKRVANLDGKKHLILQSAHPSPLSAHRGFLGNGHFKAANDWLEARYGPNGKVDWCDL